MNHPEESAWVRAAQQGDRASFARLAQAHGGALFAVAYGRLGDPTAAADIAQDALVLAFEKIGMLRKPNRFGAWIRRIATNLCARWRRDAAYRNRLEQDSAAVCERLGYVRAPTLSEALAQREAHAALHRTLQSLPATDREALILFYFEDQSIAQAAEALELSPAAFRKRLQRARDRLRIALSDQVEEGLRTLAGRNEVPKRALAAMPLGAALSKVASPASVLPKLGPLSPWIGTAGLPSFAGPCAAGLVATAIVAGLWAGFHALHPADGPPPEAKTNVTAPALPEPSSPAAASSPEPVQAAAEPAAAEAASGYEVQSLVLDPGGQPVPEATVKVLRRLPFQNSDSIEQTVAAETASGDDGAFALHLPAPGEDELVLLTSHPDWASDARRFSPLEPAVPLEIRLDRAAPVAGIVTNPQGEPVPGATVWIRSAWLPEANRLETPIRGFGPFATARSGQEGRFEFTCIPEGYCFSMAASKPGWGMNYAYSEEAVEAGRWGSELMAPCEEARIMLSRAASVSGRVLAHDSRAPVPGATVSLSTTVAGALERNATCTFEREAATDEEGRFLFENVPSTSDIGISAAQGPLKSAPAKIRFAQGAAHGARDLLLAPCATLEGRVLDATSNRPLAGATLFYYGAEERSVNRSEPTDARGYFRCEGVAAGTTRLYPSKDGWALSLASHPDVGAMEKKLTVSLEPGQTLSQLVYMEPAAPRPLRQTVSVSGIVVDAAGAPKTGVRLGDVDGYSKVVSEEGGVFTLPEAPVGAVRIRAFDDEAGLWGEAEIQVQPGAMAPIAIALDRRAARIEGHIRGAGDLRPDALRLRLESAPHEAYIFRDLSVNAEGFFTSGAIPPGPYTLDLKKGTDGFEVAPDISMQFDLEEGEAELNADFTLTPLTGTLAGAVVCSDGSPAAHRTILVEGEGGSQTGLTDENGAFELEQVDEGDLILRVGDKERDPEWTSVLTRSGQQHLQVRLRRPGTLKGFFGLPNGCTHAYVSARHELAGHYFFPSQTGAFEMKVEPGTYTLNISGIGEKEIIQGIVVRSGLTTDLGEIELADSSASR